MKYINLKKKLVKYKVLYNFLSWCKLFMFSMYYRFFWILFRIIPICKSKIVIVSFSGKGYGDNGKYISNQLLKNNQIEKIKIYWATTNLGKQTLPNNVHYCKYNSIRFLFHLYTAKIWINNSRFPYGITKRNNQYYIQTWHSSLRLKKIEKDAIDSLNPQLILTCKADSKMIDTMVSGCEYSTNTYKNSFWYNGEVLNIGTPRCDLFFNFDIKKRLKKELSKKYGFDINKKIILYAPTFRKKMNEENAYLNIEKIIHLLPKEYILFVRFHPISKYSIENNNIINMTNYGDMQELICVSDYLITDYSGCCFDMMINNKPCILFTKDIDDYLKKERNLYFSFDELPFPFVKNEEALIDLINTFNIDEYKKRVNEFKNKIGLYENGNSSHLLSELILEVIKNEKI